MTPKQLETKAKQLRSRKRLVETVEELEGGPQDLYDHRGEDQSFKQRTSPLGWWRESWISLPGHEFT